MKQSCITIVGAGQIGSRHLQALCHLENSTRIDLVDPSNESLQTARDRYKEAMPANKQSIELHCHNDLDNLPGTLDLVIIATNSIVRERVLREITEKRPVKNLILEKILFQRKAQYIGVDKFLKESGIPTWVSCWMRTTDFFKKIKSLLNPEKQIRVIIEGPQWGIGCNSVHFLDFFSYLTNAGEFKFTETELASKALESKRSGFKEFSGRIAGKDSRGNTLELICYETGAEPITIKIYNDTKTCQVIGWCGKVTLNITAKNENRTEEAYLPYQSQLTHIWVNDIFEKGSCDLPTYAESMPLHLELIRVFTSHLEKITGKEIDVCPIT
jgi:hypothetical protein